MGKQRLTQEEFILRAKEKHGDKYDYSKVVYNNVHEKVLIVCPIHKEFMQIAKDHLSGKGCRQCAIDSHRTLLYNFGINDVKNQREYGAIFTIWKNMIKRCYDEKHRDINIAYKDCKVCDEWRLFSNFYLWAKDEYRSDLDLDKDILVKGNKIYSPETCVFLPKRINRLLTNRKNHRGKCLIGVYKKDNKFIAQISKNGKAQEFIGNFKTEEEAFNSYKKAKEDYIKEIATEYYNNNLISEQVYNALFNYQIDRED